MAMKVLVSCVVSYDAVVADGKLLMTDGGGLRVENVDEIPIDKEEA
ncbi:hypothetical protein H5410_011348 [Solanum commersonii]|uniref:Uncharacterized protein n=1 Tax=Solanum commersonii TaxID=4109 RepID=A0A9J6APP2_SOLCO|nr:hypothetical protein H5410_011348 [Solanum commersonii]